MKNRAGLFVSSLFALVAMLAAPVAPGRAIAQDGAPAPAAQGEPVDVKRDLTLGVQRTYRLNRTITVEQTGAGAEPSTEQVTHAAEFVMKVVEAPASGPVKLSIDFTKVSMSARGAAGEGSAQWIADAEPADAAGVEDQSVGAVLRRLAGSLGGCAVTVEVGASGQVIAVRGFEPYQEMVSAQQAVGSPVAGFFTPEQFGEVIEPLFTGDGAAGSKMRIGHGWQDTETVALPPAGAIDMTTDLTLSGADGAIATVKGATRYEAKVPAQREADVAALSLGASEGTIETLWNLQEGALEKRTSRMTLTTIWTLGDATLNQTQKSEQSIERVRG